MEKADLYVSLADALRRAEEVGAVLDEETRPSFEAAMTALAAAIIKVEKARHFDFPISPEDERALLEFVRTIQGAFERLLVLLRPRHTLN